MRIRTSPGSSSAEANSPAGSSSRERLRVGPHRFAVGRANNSCQVPPACRWNAVLSPTRRSADRPVRRHQGENQGGRPPPSADASLAERTASL